MLELSGSIAIGVFFMGFPIVWPELFFFGNMARVVLLAMEDLHLEVWPEHKV